MRPRGCSAPLIASLAAAALVACSLDGGGQASAPDGSLGGNAGMGGSAASTGGSAGASGGSAGASGAGANGGTAGAADGSAGAAATGGITSALHETRIELPCGTHNPPGCATVHFSQSLPFEGAPATLYDVELRIRGVVEQNSYAGGTQQGGMYVGGAGVGPGWNVYSIEVSDPPAVYHLNSGTFGNLFCVLLDYQATIVIAGGATVTLTGNALDGTEVINIDSQGVPIVVPDVPPAPAAYDGQFIQIDVVSIQPA